MSSVSDEGAGRHGTAAPGIAPALSYAGPELLITVDGEEFRVRRRLRAEPPYEYDYDWVTGPNPGYGFGLSGPFEHGDDDHTAAIRDFLSSIDPATGHLR